MSLFRVCLFIQVWGMGLSACQSKPDAESTAHTSESNATTKPRAVAELESQILALHDSVMPAMSELMSLKKQVALRQTELEKQPASGPRKMQAQAVRDGLEQADRSMTDWMHQYNGDTLSTLNEQQAMAYLKDQQQHVNAMAEHMRKSIVNARAYLK